MSRPRVQAGAFGGAAVAGPAGDPVVRAYRPSDRDRVLEIIGRVWDEARRRTYAFLWDWKHARDAQGGPGRESLVVERGGRVFGYAGAIPVRFRIGSDLVDGAFGIDTFVDPEARGLGKRLMRRQLAAGALLLGAGNERSRALYSHLSGRDTLKVKEARKMACVLDPAPLLKGRGVPAPLAGIARGLNRLLRRGLAGRAGRAAPGVRLERADRFPAETADLCAGFGRRFRHQVVRDMDYLNWRFADCPFGYEIRLLRDGGRLAGYVVYRLAMLNGRRVMLLVEIVATGKPALYDRIMLDHIEAAAIASGACEIETIDPGCPVLRSVMRRKGYFHKREVLSILAYLGDGRVSPPDFRARDAWWLGAGDADFEFIFFNQGEASRVTAAIIEEGR
jgi:hypothetical protein